MLFQTVATAQTDAPAATPEPPATPVAAPTPIPFSDIIAQSEQATATLNAIASAAAVNPSADKVERELPALTEEINVKLEETARVIENRQSFEKLGSFEADWRELVKNLPQWQTDLTERARKLEVGLTQLKELENKWKTTLASTNAETPPEVLSRIQNNLNAIAETRRQIETQQARIVTLQDRIAEQQKRVEQAAASLRQTRNSLVGQILVRDNPPIWSRELWSGSKPGTRLDLGASLAAQSKSLTDFIARNQTAMIVHFLMFAALAGFLIFLRRRVEQAVEKDAGLKNAAVIFYSPIPAALVMLILIRDAFYQQTPQIVDSLFGAILLVPVIIILRKLVGRPLYPILYSLVVFYFIDLLRSVIDVQTTDARLLFLIEMLGGLIFFLVLMRTRLSRYISERMSENRSFRLFNFVAFVALPVFAVAFLANALGYLGLAQFLGNAVLRISYAALILYAIVRIGDGLIIFALRFRPLSLLKMVEQYRPSIQKKLRRFLRGLAVFIWILVILEFLALRDQVFKTIESIIVAELTLGSLSISLGSILLFGVTVWSAFLLSRFLRFVLEEDVFPRVALERGLPYTISTLLHYIILLLGFFLAVGAAGFDLTRFTILAGAFGVGIGFGLQNIINNFVSGLILLFERPIKIGDRVKIGDVTGIVRKIGIRASIVQVWDSSDTIVPNSKLISENVTNWTFSNQQRGIEIVFSVLPEQKVEPKRIIEIMEQAAEKNPLVGDKPPPQVLFDEVSFDRLNFKLRVWTDYFDKVLKIRSDLVLNISEALSAEDIKHEQSPSDTPPP